MKLFYITDNSNEQTHPADGNRHKFTVKWKFHFRIDGLFQIYFCDMKLYGLATILFLQSTFSFTLFKKL